MIRTRDPLTPSQVRYRAALRPDQLNEQDFPSLSGLRMQALIFGHGEQIGTKVPRGTLEAESRMFFIHPEGGSGLRRGPVSKPQQAPSGKCFAVTVDRAVRVSILLLSPVSLA